jgi:protein-L-isoaspartate(D-aspartate) O-methyltransferase
MFLVSCIKLSVMRFLIIIFTGLTILTYSQPKDMFEIRRKQMVEDQIISRNVTHPATIKAMKKVPRHMFVPKDMQDEAYLDGPLSIGHGQTISQPYIVAYMTQVVNPSKGKKVLEIGTGSGYQAAILAEIVDTVYTVELLPELAKASGKRLKGLGYNNIIARQGDGYKGWPEHAPYDIIVVTAAPDHIPQPLIDQLAEKGRMVIPVGLPSAIQELVYLEKKNGKVEKKKLTLVRFVPMLRDKPDS